MTFIKGAQIFGKREGGNVELTVRVAAICDWKNFFFFSSLCILVNVLFNVEIYMCMDNGREVDGVLKTATSVLAHELPEDFTQASKKLVHSGK